LGHAGLLDHAVDPDTLYAVGVEQFVRGGEEAISRRGPKHGGGVERPCGYVAHARLVPGIGGL